MRRRKPRVVWLPQTNRNSIDFLTTDFSGYQEFIVEAVGGKGDFAVGEIPLVIDSQDDPLAAESSLSDLENSGYRLRRIVGKVWCAANQIASETPVTVICTAGIIVRRSDPATGNSFALTTGDATLLAPGVIQNWGDPWIWRRSWILRNSLALSGGGAADTDAPPSNFGRDAGSVADGPHVDQKTARIVGPEERLFLTFDVTILRAGLDQQTPLPVHVITDLRCLATMRTSSGNRRNASR